MDPADVAVLEPGPPTRIYSSTTRSSRAALWKRLPEAVFSTKLSTVQGTARVASGGLAEENARLPARAT